jgi:hypothetical protein
MEVHHDMDNSQLHLDHVQESVDAFIAICAKSPRTCRKKLRSSVRLGLDPIGAQLDASNTLSDELRRLDERKEPVQLSFNDATVRLLDALQMAPCIKGDSVDGQSFRTPQSPISSQLAAYYAAVSTTQIMGERIGELGSGQHERYERRSLMGDQGQMLDQSDDEFLRQSEGTLLSADQDYEPAQRNLGSARSSCEYAGIVMPAWAMRNNAGQPAFDDAGRLKEESPTLDSTEAGLDYLKHVELWCESSEKGRLEHRGKGNDTSTRRTMPAWRHFLSDVHQTWTLRPLRLARSYLPLIAVAMPLVSASSKDVMVQDALPTVTELDGLRSPRHDHNAIRQALSTASQYMLAISPPLILVGGVAGSAWILTREKRAFERQHFLFLMTFTTSVSWWVLAATTTSSGNGSTVSMSTWLALTAIYTSRNHRGLRNGTWHLFVVLFGGLAISSLFALALPTVNEASMERFIQNFLIVGPSVLTVWTWLAARGQRELEGSTNAVSQESIELQGSANAVAQ